MTRSHTEQQAYVARLAQKTEPKKEPPKEGQPPDFNCYQREYSQPRAVNPTTSLMPGKTTVPGEQSVVMEQGAPDVPSSSGGGTGSWSAGKSSSSSGPPSGYGSQMKNALEEGHQGPVGAQAGAGGKKTPSKNPKKIVAGAAYGVSVFGGGKKNKQLFKKPRRSHLPPFKQSSADGSVAGPFDARFAELFATQKTLVNFSNLDPAATREILEEILWAAVMIAKEMTVAHSSARARNDGSAPVAAILETANDTSVDKDILDVIPNIQQLLLWLWCQKQSLSTFALRQIEQNMSLLFATIFAGSGGSKQKSSRGSTTAATSELQHIHQLVKAMPRTKDLAGLVTAEDLTKLRDRVLARALEGSAAEDEDGAARGADVEVDGGSAEEDEQLCHTATGATESSAPGIMAKEVEETRRCSDGSPREKVVLGEGAVENDGAAENDHVLSLDKSTSPLQPSQPSNHSPLNFSDVDKTFVFNLDGKPKGAQFVQAAAVSLLAAEIDDTLGEANRLVVGTSCSSGSCPSPEKREVSRPSPDDDPSLELTGSSEASTTAAEGASPPTQASPQDVAEPPTHNISSSSSARSGAEDSTDTRSAGSEEASLARMKAHLKTRNVLIVEEGCSSTSRGRKTGSQNLLGRPDAKDVRRTKLSFWTPDSFAGAPAQK